METKTGCRLELIMNCYDEKGELISDIPKGSWFGNTRDELNGMSRSLTRAVVDVTEVWDKTRSEAKANPASERPRR